MQFQTIPAAESLRHIGKLAIVCGRITDELDAQTSLSSDSARFIQLDGGESFTVLTWFHDKATLCAPTDQALFWFIERATMDHLADDPVCAGRRGVRFIVSRMIMSFIMRLKHSLQSISVL
jgi:hypothetical protein